MASLLARIRAKAYLIGALALAALAAIARILFLKGQRNRYKKSSQRFKAQAEQEIKINESEAEISQEFSHRADEARKDLKAGKMPENIKNRNDY